jgi:hypothetical protein
MLPYGVVFSKQSGTVDNPNFNTKYRPTTISDADLLAVFPEALPLVKKYIRDIKQKIDEVNKQNLPHFDSALERIYAEGMDEGRNEIAIMLAKWWHLDQHLDPLIKRLAHYEKLLRLHSIRINMKDSPGEVNELTIRNAKEVEMASLITEKPNHAGFINCPFHGEKTASCKIHKHRFHCFGCGEDGDVIDWVMKTEGRTFLEAVRKLNGR